MRFTEVSRPIPRCWLCACLIVLAAVPFVGAANWPQWRGPTADGVSAETNLPTEWDEARNMAWTLPLPGHSGATPVIWGDRIFLPSDDGKEVSLLCVTTERKELWKRKLGASSGRWYGPSRDEGDDSSPSPSTDGKHVYTFTGTGDLACHDFNGNEVWHFNAQQRYGRFRIGWGMHVTPLLDRDRLYLALMHSGRVQIVTALEKATGKEIWKVDRPSDGRGECLEVYASPTLWRRGNEAYLVVHGNDYTTAHSLDDGRELWRLGDLNPKDRYNSTLRFVATPLVTPDLIVVPTAKAGPTVAVNPDARGPIKAGGPGELWRLTRTPDVPAPLIHDGLLYLCHQNGVWLMCLDAKTGREVYSQRLHSSRYRASPVFADGKIYLTARDGVVTVVKAGPKFERLAENKLPDQIAASPVIADGRIYLRGFKALYAIGKATK
jgi:outer membrane protein assembly factor BamB